MLPSTTSALEARGEIHQHILCRDADVIRASEAAARSIEESAAGARAKLDALKQRRRDIEAQFRENVEARTRDASDFIDHVSEQGISMVLDAEGHRHHAALAVFSTGDTARAAKIAAQAEIAQDELLAQRRAEEVARLRHETQVQCGTAIELELRGSAAELGAARGYCGQVKAGLARETAQYANRVTQVEQEHAAKAWEAERQARAIEMDRVGAFLDGHSSVKEAEARIQSRREASDAELDTIQRRLREVEQETQAQANQILAQWAAGSAATEEEVRRLEQQGRETCAKLQAEMDRHTQGHADRSCALQQQSSRAVVALHQQAAESVDATQPSLEAACRGDDEAAQSAREEARRWRPEPERIRAAADAAVEADQALAAAEDERLSREAEARITAANAAVRAARENEKRLVAEACAAKDRLREACYRLRLNNLHDFAIGITTGSFDSKLALTGAAPEVADA